MYELYIKCNNITFIVSQSLGRKQDRWHADAAHGCGGGIIEIECCYNFFIKGFPAFTNNVMPFLACCSSVNGKYR